MIICRRIELQLMAGTSSYSRWIALTTAAAQFIGHWINMSKSCDERGWGLVWLWRNCATAFLCNHFRVIYIFHTYGTIRFGVNRIKSEEGDWNSNRRCRLHILDSVVHCIRFYIWWRLSRSSMSCRLILLQVAMLG